MTVIAEIQVAPSPPGTADDPHAHVEAAIAVIEASGLRYEVGALGTTLEGEADEVWATLRAAHEAMLAAGATGGLSHIKVASVNRTMDSLTPSSGHNTAILRIAPRPRAVPLRAEPLLRPCAGPSGPHSGRQSWSRPIVPPA